VSVFRFVKYSSILFFLGKYKTKLFRVVAVLIFAFITSMLYQDVANFLQQQYPNTVVYALIGKIVIVYGALIFVLFQFRPDPEDKLNALSQPPETSKLDPTSSSQSKSPNDRLTALEDVTQKGKLRSRYEDVMKRESD